MPIGANTKKNFFNSAANGFLGELSDLVGRYPELLRLTNDRNGHLAIFYAMKNGHADCALYLMQLGQRITSHEFRRIISDSRIPDRHYLMFREILSIYPFSGHLEGFTNDESVYKILKQSCFDRRNLSGLERLISIKGEPWEKVLVEYREYSPTKLNSQFMRDMTLKYLIGEKEEIL